MSKKEFLKLAEEVYQSAQEEKAGVIQLSCMINSKQQGTTLKISRM